MVAIDITPLPAQHSGEPDAAATAICRNNRKVPNIESHTKTHTDTSPHTQPAARMLTCIHHQAESHIFVYRVGAFRSVF